MSPPSSVVAYDDLVIAFESMEGRDGFRGTVSVSERDPMPTRHTLPFQIGEGGPAITSLARSVRSRRMAQRLDSSSDVQVVGAALFEALFGSGLEKVYSELMGRLDSSRRGLRIRLVFPVARGPDPTDVERFLSPLPWETLFDPQRRDFVALLPRVSLVRGTKTQGEPRRLRIVRKPKVLFVGVDDAIQSIGVQREQEALQTFLDPAGPPLINPTPAALLSALERTDADILHFSGSVRQDDPLRLPLSASYDKAAPDDAWVSAEDLVWRLGDRETGTVQLVYLNACYSQILAGKLLAAVPATIGVQGLVEVNPAIQFATRFYQDLSRGASLDVALAGARDAVDRDFPGNEGWALPSLWTNDDDCQLVLAESSVSPDLPPPESLHRGESFRLEIRRGMAAKNLTKLIANAGDKLNIEQLRAWLDEGPEKLREALTEAHVQPHVAEQLRDETQRLVEANRAFESLRRPDTAPEPEAP